MPSASIPILSVSKIITKDGSCILPGKTPHDERWDRGEPDALIELPPSKRPKKTPSDTAGSSSETQKNGASYNARDCLRESPSAAADGSDSNPRSPPTPNDLPRFKLADVTSFRTFRAGRVYEVGIQGKTFLYKTDPNPDRLACESGRPSRIVRAGLPLRIPTVEGYLGIELEFPGLLMTFIPSITLQDLVDQESAAAKTVGGNNDNDKDPDHEKHAEKLAERWKWFHQIRETVVALHKHGCHWGDAKPSNVVIDDANRDVWLIDFGGGWTTGFVSAELCDTDAGDLEGLAAIGVFLGLPIYPRTQSQNETRCQ
ncbi:hypothetical protein BP00DRAFT_492466 [Aspergillus indologenus CBS 114.80]|uniref:Protein kinase domain-containing protein n=1 Tax=Aspergillus indologenus CBS 114.80 TaxID=1450541 RepID=A0A2V5JG53_9EURO|nr:hypothetical protein BP00DRAFT_492466 [Aspergillus indologenus CBS 114.80]